MSSQLLLEELGVDYEIVLFNVHTPEDFPAEFLALNPNARVPVLLTPIGPIYESAAIMLYLCEMHEGRYMPATESAERGRFLQWMVYLMSTFQPEVLIQFHPEKYFPDDEIMRDALKHASMKEISRLWKIIEDALSPGPFFLGRAYSICDMLFVMQAIWTENQPADLSAFANSSRLMNTAFERPAVQRVLAEHQIEHLTAIWQS
jgi:glutathione S-transferase